MATFYLIRHGKPDYTYGDTHGFIGQGHDFVPLKQDRIREVIETSKDARLKNAQIIVASPYTRALQTASIISKETGLEIVVEPDIREWQPDLTYQYKNSDEMKRLDLGQVFRHIFLRIFINYSSFAGAVDINIKENL